MAHALVFLSLGGVFAGLLAGLLGVGGGIILVPLLTLILPLFGIEKGLVMHAAVATSMAVISVTSLSSARVHRRQGQVVWPVFYNLTLGTMIGTFIGVHVAHFLPGKSLHLIFSFCTFAIAMHTLFDINPKVKRDVPGRIGLILGGIVIGIVCALLGMGGGALIVPYLNRYKLTMHNIISTSTLCTIPIAMIGSLGFIMLGLSQATLNTIPWSTGYIYWPAFLATAFAGVIFAPIGARLAHQIPSYLLKRIFGVFLIVVSIHMFLVGIK